MSQFLTRIELHSATAEDYEKLAKAMLSRNFKKFILSADGQSYRLPAAEYLYEGEITLTAVRDLARDAATSTGRESWVLTVESKGAAWFLPLGS